MAFNIKLLLGICSITIILVHAAATLPQEEINGILDVHNKARAEVKNGPLKWSETLAQHAQDYANKRIDDCAMEHSNGPYGENLAAGNGMTTAVATKYWLGEKELYDYNQNKCVGDSSGCLHYVTAIWGKTTDVGCAVSKCKSGENFIVCEYDPYIAASPEERPY